MLKILWERDVLVEMDHAVVKGRLVAPKGQVRPSIVVVCRVQRLAIAVLEEPPLPNVDRIRSTRRGSW